MQFIAQDWLVLELTETPPSALGIVTALQFTPVLLLTLYGGKLADRHDKRRLLIGANAAFSVLALGLGLLVATGTVTLGWVFVFAALMGVVNAIETPVRQSFVSELVAARTAAQRAVPVGGRRSTPLASSGPALAGLAIGARRHAARSSCSTRSPTWRRPSSCWRMRRRRRCTARPRPRDRQPRIRDGLRYVLAAATTWCCRSCC